MVGECDGLLAVEKLPGDGVVRFERLSTCLSTFLDLLAIIDPE